MTEDELRAEVARLRALLHRDQTGLAAALTAQVIAMKTTGRSFLGPNREPL